MLISSNLSSSNFSSSVSIVLINSVVYVPDAGIIVNILSSLGLFSASVLILTSSAMIVLSSFLISNSLSISKVMVDDAISLTSFSKE